MRGKHGAHAAKTARNRIIPAHAGQTRPQVPALGAITDHPRACGANKYPMICHVGRFGSSPRMRGKPGALNVPHSSSRIIPAHAGQTLRCCCRRCDIPDHPRACGANWKRPWRNYPKPGSSPRMRGKLLFCHCVSSLLRIIPAHAGQTRTIPAPPRQKADHPRACGANCANESALSAVVGSSPRMRGKPCLCCEEPAYTRIIPAHAGQTPSPETCGRPRTDHPRACGANYTADRTPCKRCGSSPRMRGKLLRQMAALREERIIPAHAGQTFC